MHYNNIRIARGERSAWLKHANGSYGELFYDRNTKGVYIAIEGGEEGLQLKRFGGFDSIVLKGTIDSESFSEIKRIAEPGDAYIVTGSISVVMDEPVFDNAGNVTKTQSKRLYDNYFKNGQVIIFTKDDVSGIPNAYKFSDDEIYNNEEGAVGIVTLAGTAEAVDLEYDPSKTEVSTNTDVQSALDALFNEKMSYIGTFDDVSISSTDVLGEDDYQPATGEDPFWAIIAKKKQLKMGQSMVYSGKSKTIKAEDSGLANDVTVKTNTMIINNGGVIYTIPLGAGESRDIAVVFTGETKSDENHGTFQSTQANGTKVELEEDQISTVQHALDFLHQCKADLNANGKIPLSQIPTTIIGALQYIGTTIIDEDTEALTVSELAALMAAKKDDSWEKDEGVPKTDESVTKKAYDTLDSGDYVIVSVAKPTVEGAEHNLSRQVVITDDDHNELFKVSNGDHIIVNSVSDDGITFDHLDSSAAVDAVNGIMGSVEIIKNDRFLAKEEPLNETTILTDPLYHQIKVQTPNAVLEDEEIPEGNIPQAGRAKTIKKSDLSIVGASNDPDNKHNTLLTGKTSDGADVTVEFPDADGKMSVTAGDGTEDVIPKYDADGNLTDSDIKQYENLEDGTRTVELSSDGHDKLKINYNDWSKLLQFEPGKEERTTVLFDGFDSNNHSESRYGEENTKVVLDWDSTIDGGEWYDVH